MFKNSFFKVACITPNLEVGNPLFNAQEITKALGKSYAALSVFPELCLTGYTCGDLFYQSLLMEDVYQALTYILQNNEYLGIAIVGAPLELNGSLFNCAIVIQKGHILGVVPKTSLPNTKEFSEKRWFKSSLNETANEIVINGAVYPFGNLIFSDIKHNIHFGVEICEDMWSNITPGSLLSLKGCNLLVNLSASNETLGKSEIRRTAIVDNCRKNCGAYVYASAGANESTSDTVFSGHNIIASVGEILQETQNFSFDTEIIYGDLDFGKINFKRKSNTNLHESFDIKFETKQILISFEESEDYRFNQPLNKYPFLPAKEQQAVDFKKITDILVYSLIKRLKHTKVKTLIIGVSGGLDSTLALLVAYDAFKKLNYDMQNIIAVTMPGFGTSNRTKNNAMKLMEYLGVRVLVKSIDESTKQHFKLIEHDEEIKDVTYENVQARIRTLILMNLANKYNGLVLGTGDLSELALGWCTYNGDQMSMYGINAGLPKTLVRFMVESCANFTYQEIKAILLDIVSTPISPELVSNSQKTEDSVGKYEINDYILWRFLECGDSEKRIMYLVSIAFEMKEEVAKQYVDKFFFRFFTQQFKRQALPDGPKVLEISLSSRMDFRMPSDIKRW